MAVEETNATAAAAATATEAAKLEIEAVRSEALSRMGFGGVN